MIPKFYIDQSWCAFMSINFIMIKAEERTWVRSWRSYQTHESEWDILMTILLSDSLVFNMIFVHEIKFVLQPWPWYNFLFQFIISLPQKSLPSKLWIFKFRKMQKMCTRSHSILQILHKKYIKGNLEFIYQSIIYLLSTRLPFRWVYMAVYVNAIKMIKLNANVIDVQYKCAIY